MKDEAPVQYVKRGDDPRIDVALGGLAPGEEAAAKKPPKRERTPGAKGVAANGRRRVRARHIAMAVACVIAPVLVALWGGMKVASNGTKNEAAMSGTASGIEGGGPVRGGPGSGSAAPPASASTATSVPATATATGTATATTASMSTSAKPAPRPTMDPPVDAGALPEPTSTPTAEPSAAPIVTAAPSAAPSVTVMPAAPAATTKPSPSGSGRLPDPKPIF
jgi:hypothetical protein